MRIIVQSPSPLSPDSLQRLASRLGATRFSCQGAAQAEFSLDPRTAAPREQLHAICQDAGLDSAVLEQPRPLSDFRLIVFDMDSTLINIECIDELAGLVGKKAEVAALTEQAMQSAAVDYDTSLRLRTRLLAGLPVEAFDGLYRERLRFSPGARQLVEAVRAAGLKTAIVSGGFDYFTGRVRAELGIDVDRSNRLAVKNGRLTGELEGTLINADVKAQFVEQLCAGMGIPTTDAIVVGDGSNDRKMMRLAGLSVGFRPKPVLRTMLDVVLDHLGLDALPGFLAPAAAAAPR